MISEQRLLLTRCRAWSGRALRHPAPPV